jgi:sec-independent protein translocase protein TatA
MVGDILQPTHLVFVLVIALLVLGPKKLPEVGRQLGNGLRDFRAAINGEHREPEEVQAPYEQNVPDTTAEHEFAHEPAAEATSNGHEFAHEASAEATSEGHEFAHEASAEATSNGHEFAHESETAAGSDDTAPGEKPDGGHEFAYETSDSSDKRTDPLA